MICNTVGLGAFVPQLKAVIWIDEETASAIQKSPTLAVVLQHGDDPDHRR